MSAALRAELFKQRSTRTGLGVFGAMLGLVVFVVLLHGLALPTRILGNASEQLTIVFGWGEVFGALFAALLGAMSITGEIRHGTIRPTLLVNPSRRSVVAAKVWASMLIGTGFGLGAGAAAAGVGTAALRARGIDVLLDAGDYGLLVTGGAAAAALWAAIGVGLGAVVRNQVPI
ncbi:MAG: ABC transporter permease, partial [Actinomycetota bacterium]|nr:ABC transporter permease [Actinomycetota bacterium]